jgi:hypothetical protein
MILPSGLDPTARTGGMTDIDGRLCAAYQAMWARHARGDAPGSCPHATPSTGLGRVSVLRPPASISQGDTRQAPPASPMRPCPRITPLRGPGYRRKAVEAGRGRYRVAPCAKGHEREINMPEHAASVGPARGRSKPVRSRAGLAVSSLSQVLQAVARPYPHPRSLR